MSPLHQVIGNNNITIHNINGSNIEVTQVIGKSVEYQTLESELKKLKEHYDDIPVEKIERREKISEEISNKEKIIEKFKQDVIRLARTFQNIIIKTDRLNIAKKYFDVGEFKKAEEILNSDELYSDKKRFIEARSDVKSELDNIEQKIQQLATEFLIKAKIITLDTDNCYQFEEIENLYKESIECVAFYDNLTEYAYFLHTHNQYLDAEIVYQKIRSELWDHLTQSQRVHFLNNHANLLIDLCETISAKTEIQESYDILISLSEDEQSINLPDMAVILNNIAIIYKEEGDFESAEPEFQEALKIYRLLAKNEPQEYLPFVAIILSNLGAIHTDLNEYDTAKGELQEALKIYSILSEDTREANSKDLAFTLTNFGLLCKDLNNYESAEYYLQEALIICRKLVSKNPHAYLPYLASTLNNIANLHVKRRDYPSAECEFQETLKIRRTLAEKNPQTYHPLIASILYNLAFLHFISNKSKLALLEYQEALEIYRDQEARSQHKYLPEIAMIFYNLAKIHCSMNDFKSAVKELMEAIQIYRNLAITDPQTYQSYLTEALTKSGLVFFKLRERENSLLNAQEALSNLDNFSNIILDSEELFNINRNLVKYWQFKG